LNTNAYVLKDTPGVVIPPTKVAVGVLWVVVAGFNNKIILIIKVVIQLAVKVSEVFIDFAIPLNVVIMEEDVPFLGRTLWLTEPFG
jgi:hypothetical protein